MVKQLMKLVWLVQPSPPAPGDQLGLDHQQLS